MLKRRLPALILRPDLTPFVSVALLLIVFFVWVKELQRKTLLTGNVPDGPCHKYTCDEPRHTDAVLFLLAKNRLAVLHFVNGTDTAELVETDYSSLTRFLRLMRRPSHQVTVVIKPTAQATVGNLVNVINKLALITDIPYALDCFINNNETTLLTRYAEHRLNRNKRLITMKLYTSYTSRPYLLSYPVSRTGLKSKSN